VTAVLGRVAVLTISPDASRGVARRRATIALADCRHRSSCDLMESRSHLSRRRTAIIALTPMWLQGPPQLRLVDRPPGPLPAANPPSSASVIVRRERPQFDFTGFGRRREERRRRGPPLRRCVDAKQVCWPTSATDAVVSVVRSSSRWLTTTSPASHDDRTDHQLIVQ